MQVAELRERVQQLEGGLQEILSLAEELLGLEDDETEDSEV